MPHTHTRTQCVWRHVANADANVFLNGVNKFVQVFILLFCSKKERGIRIDREDLLLIGWAGVWEGSRYVSSRQRRGGLTLDHQSAQSADVTCVTVVFGCCSLQQI